ncbi:MAG: DEAD/DEAH box helicase, partial [Myxococcales bacterium]|nr:DEAD/DEAH box helicase [Myxococcales bacterium]
AVALRLDLGLGPIRSALERLRQRDRLLEGEFLPGGREREWVDVEVLRRLKRASLARLTAAVEAVEPRLYARFLPTWHRIDHPGEGLDDLLAVVEQIQGVPLPFTDLEHSVLPARIRGYHPGMLDQLCASGEVVWRGFENPSGREGRVALYLAEHLRALTPLVEHPPEGEVHQRIRELLHERGAVFFADIERELGGFSGQLLDALWDLVWAGEIGNDTLAPLRARVRATGKQSNRGRSARRRPSLYGAGVDRLYARRAGPPGSEGRWSALPDAGDLTATERATATAVQLLERHGVVTREAIRGEGLPGGFSAYYPIFKAMEAAGKIRRGYFIAGMGGAQFGLPGAEDRLRDEAQNREPPVVLLAACDPANAWGSALPWPRKEEVRARPQRSAGARVFLEDGRLLAWLSRSERQLLSFIDETHCPDPGQRERSSMALANALFELLHTTKASKVLLLEKIDDEFANEHPLANSMEKVGFRRTHDGLLLQRNRIA